MFRGLMRLAPHSYDVTPEGRRFLLVAAPTLSDAAPIVVVVNWTSGLK